MSRLVMAAAALLVVFAAAGAAGGKPIRDIEGPLPPSGLPPFAATAAVLAAAAGGGALWSRRKHDAEDAAAGPGTVPIEPDVAALRGAYLAGELSEAALFDRLSELLRATLSAPEGNGCGALTSEELLAASSRILTGSEMACAASLLELCDQVRFGGGIPGKEAVLTALDQAAAAVSLLRR